MSDYKNTAYFVGYSALIERFRLSVIPNWHRSFIAETGVRRTNVAADGTIEEIFPARYTPDDSVGGQLEFALKYDGTNLALLLCIFRAAGQQKIEEYVRLKPNGKYVRRLWFFYEKLTGQKLNIDDLSSGGYVEALDPSEYYVLAKGTLSARHRIYDNLPGTEQFCPLVRKTKCLQELEMSNLPHWYRQVLTSYSPLQVKRAMNYLYIKETKSSFEIEHISPSTSRTERFAALLQAAGNEDYGSKQSLIALQNKIVDERFRDTDYRSTQNYIGETVDWRQEIVHYIPPRPEDLSRLMDGLLALHQRMGSGNVHAVIHAASVSFGFVFLHPFEDGNGRIHRFLLHHILLARGFTPQGIVFPVSAAMVRRKKDYDDALEAFSKPLMRLIDYEIDGEGRLTVVGDTVGDCWYRYMDLTRQVEILSDLIQQTVVSDIAAELKFIAMYDKAKRLIHEIVDLPDKQIDLMIRLCLQNNKQLSATKRASHFDFLTDGEVVKIEAAIQSAFGE